MGRGICWHIWRTDWEASELAERHNRLQKLAITDELTGLYNARYFKHFLSRIIDRARSKLFPVTL
jgi:PleD family two-component response regulator